MVDVCWPMRLANHTPPPRITHSHEWHYRVRYRNTHTHTCLSIIIIISQAPLHAILPQFMFILLIINWNTGETCYGTVTHPTDNRREVFLFPFNVPQCFRRSTVGLLWQC